MAQSYILPYALKTGATGVVDVINTGATGVVDVITTGATGIASFMMKLFVGTPVPTFPNQTSFDTENFSGAFTTTTPFQAFCIDKRANKIVHKYSLNRDLTIIDYTVTNHRQSPPTIDHLYENGRTFKPMEEGQQGKYIFDIVCEQIKSHFM